MCNWVRTVQTSGLGNGTESPSIIGLRNTFQRTVIHLQLNIYQTLLKAYPSLKLFIKASQSIYDLIHF